MFRQQSQVVDKSVSQFGIVTEGQPGLLGDIAVVPASAVGGEGPGG